MDGICDMVNVIQEINKMQVDLDMSKLNLKTAELLGYPQDHNMKEARKIYNDKVEEFDRKVKELKYNYI